MGIALGCIHLSLEDFCMLLPEEFDAISKAHYTENDTHFKNDWARMRMLATICVQPHIKNHITPEKLLPFPWEEDRQKTPHMSREEQCKRARELEMRLKKNNY